MTTTPFDKFRSALAAQTLAAVWRGYGSALFLEFGRLSEATERDHSARNLRGEYTVMIEWSWRIENIDSILCGSWSDEDDWDDVFKSLIGRRVEDVSLFGRLPELSIALSGGVYVVSFMTADGQPEWTIFDNAIGTDGVRRFISVENGQVREGEGAGKAL